MRTIKRWLLTVLLSMFMAACDSRKPLAPESISPSSSQRTIYIEDESVRTAVVSALNSRAIEFDIHYDGTIVYSDRDVTAVQMIVDREVFAPKIGASSTTLYFPDKESTFRLEKLLRERGISFELTSERGQPAVLLDMADEDKWQPLVNIVSEQYEAEYRPH